jgi:hypothetical protein
MTSMSHFEYNSAIFLCACYFSFYGLQSYLMSVSMQIPLHEHCNSEKVHAQKHAIDISHNSPKY